MEKNTIPTCEEETRLGTNLIPTCEEEIFHRRRFALEKNTVPTCEEEVRFEIALDSDLRGRDPFPTCEGKICSEGGERSRLGESELRGRYFS